MSKKENLLKFWESLEGSKTSNNLKPSPRKKPSNVNVPTRKRTQNDNSNIVTSKSAIVMTTNKPEELPMLPRHDILPQPTKSRPRRERNHQNVTHRSTVDNKVNKDTTDVLNETPPAAENEFEAGTIVEHGIGRMDDVKKKITEEFMKKISTKSGPNTYPKPGASPRRASLQGYQNFNSVKEVNTRSRKSVGDVFGDRISSATPSRNSSSFTPSEQVISPGTSHFTSLVSGARAQFDKTTLKHTLSPEHPSLIRSATWMEEFKPSTKYGNCNQSPSRDFVQRNTASQHRPDEVRKEFEERLTKLESELSEERDRRIMIEQQLLEIRNYLRLR